MAGSPGQALAAADAPVKISLCSSQFGEAQSRLLVGSRFCTLFVQMGSEEFKPWLPCLRLRSRRGYELGFAIGQHFATMIHSRFKQDPYLHSQMLPFAMSADGQQLVSSLSATNK
jgi:hypothetical protein